MDVLEGGDVHPQGGELGEEGGGEGGESFEEGSVERGGRGRRKWEEGDTGPGWGAFYEGGHGLGVRNGGGGL